MTIGYDDARALVDDARARALALGKALSIAVVDYGGFEVLVERMDGARPMTPSIAVAKAYSAAVMQRPTRMLESWRDSDPVFFTQVGRMGHHPIVATLGGYTLKRGDTIVGGLGIAGGSAQEDEEIAAAVVAAAGFATDFPAWAGTPKAEPFVTSSRADVSTDRPGRYAKQLVSHLGRRNGGEWSDENGTGWIQLRTGRAFLASRPENPPPRGGRRRRRGRRPGVRGPAGGRRGPSPGAVRR